MPKPLEQTSVTLGACDPHRYGKQGVLRCPHGCVTQCEKERRKS